MSSEKTPSDRVYENGLNFGVTAENDAAETGISWETSVPDESCAGEMDAARFAATQFQYSSLSHLILGGKIVKCETTPTDLDAMRLANRLTTMYVDSVDAWGRYLRHTGAEATVSREMKAYFQKLFSEQSTTTLFLGMSVFGGTVAYALQNQLDAVDNPLFGQVLDHVAQQKKEQLDMLRTYLSSATSQLDATEQDQLADTAAQYRDAAVDVLRAHSDVFADSGIDVKRVADAAVQATDAFYTDIGIKTQHEPQQPSRPTAHHPAQRDQGEKTTLSPFLQ